MGGRAHGLQVALGALIAGVVLAMTGCGAAALPPPPPPTATIVSGATAVPTAHASAAAGSPAATAAGNNQAQIGAGKTAFSAVGCGGCHALSSAGATGSAGPSLNAIGAKRDAAWILAQIGNPCAPGHADAAGPNYTCGAMPPNLAQGAQAVAIAAFLASQK